MVADQNDCESQGRDGGDQMGVPNLLPPRRGQRDPTGIVLSPLEEDLSLESRHPIPNIKTVGDRAVRPAKI